MSAPSCFRKIVRKARKKHKCCECNKVIVVGEKYEYCSGVWDGEPAAYKTCMDCADYRQYVIREYDVYPEEVIFEQLLDDFPKCAERLDNV